jgi:hypothetical protein
LRRFPLPSNIPVGLELQGTCEANLFAELGHPFNKFLVECFIQTHGTLAKFDTLGFPLSHDIQRLQTTRSLHPEMGASLLTFPETALLYFYAHIYAKPSK